MNDWHSTTLGKVLPFQYGKNLPKGARSHTGEFAVVSSAGFIDTHSEPLTKDPTVVIGRKGTVGSVFYCPDPVFPIDTTFYVEGSSKVSIRFAYYLLKSLPLTEMNTDAAVPGLNRANAERLEIQLPGPEYQQAIVEVLGSIDDLIENNRRRIEVLEKMARFMYREWFVKFRYPGHEDVPMVDSALGPIPEGWKVGTVRHASAVVVRGISPKYAEDGEWVVINQKCIRDGRVSLGPSRRQEREVSDAKRIRAGDVLINSTGVGTLGRVAMYRGSSEGVTVDSHVTIARPVQDSLNPWYAMSILDKQSEIERLGAGATGQTELRKTDVEALDLLRPAQNVIEAFAAVVSPLFGQTDVLSAGIETLSALRDLLLPKLVTGQIDVSTLDLDALIAEQVS